MKPQTTSELETSNYFASLDKICRIHGFSYVEDLILSYQEDVQVPCCCIAGCESETDGYCEHGCPSIFLEFGII